MLQKDSEKNTTLLDYLQVALDCPYLSNLYFATPFCQIAQALREVIPEAYPLDDWEHVAQYLFREDMTFANQAEAKEYIVRFGIKLMTSPSQSQK